jgi:hypothetical protein
VFLGVNKYAPIAAIEGDMGWTLSNTRRRLNMIRYWNTLVNMQENRLPKKNFEMGIRNKKFQQLGG